MAVLYKVWGNYSLTSHNIFLSLTLILSTFILNSRTLEDSGDPLHFPASSLNFRPIFKLSGERSSFFFPENFSAFFFSKSGNFLSPLLMASSSSAYANREIVFEPNFDYDSFRGGVFCTGGLRILDNNCVRPLFSPPNRAYPRVVKQFYESFCIVDNDDDDDEDEEEDTFAVTIDGTEYNFDYNLIAEALGVPSRPIVYKFSMDILIRDLNFRPKVVDALSKVRVSYMHEDMFLVDHFFSEVLCPVMHDNERPQYVLKYLHGLYKKKKLDVASLFIDIIDHVRTGGRKNAKPHKLVYPRFITAILETSGYVFKSDEEVVTRFRTVNYSNSKRTLLKLGGAAGITAPEDQPTQRLSSHMRPSETRPGQASEVPVATSEPIADSSSQSHHFMSRAEYEYLNNRLDGQDEEIEALSSRTASLYFRQQVSIQRQWGDDAAFIFSEAQTLEEQDAAFRMARRAARAARHRESGTSSSQRGR